MISRRKSRGFLSSRNKRKSRLFLTEPVFSAPYQYYHGRDQLKETYPDKFDDDYSYYHFPESRREFYDKDFGRESYNVPEYYRENPFASAFVERYPKPKTKKSPIPTSFFRRADERYGIDRFRESMDEKIYENIIDELSDESNLPDATLTGNRRAEYFGNGNGGFSKFGNYEVGADEMREEEGQGRRLGKSRFGRAGKRKFGKRK